MLTLTAKTRDKGKKLETLRKDGFLPVVLYGSKIENQPLKVGLKEFKKVHQAAGESSLISLQVEGNKEELLVLIHDAQYHPLTDEFIHVDLYRPALDEETEASVPLVFVGESLAVKDLGGTLVKAIKELEVRALPQNLPHEITVDISKLKTFEDIILVKDLNVPEGVKILKEEDEAIALVTPQKNIDEELEKPIEEKVDEVEKVETKASEEDVVEEVKE
ncbi:MAG: 50S ribosomal protein L25 [bacterium]